MSGFYSARLVSVIGPKVAAKGYQKGFACNGLGAGQSAGHRSFCNATRRRPASLALPVSFLKSKASPICQFLQTAALSTSQTLSQAARSHGNDLGVIRDPSHPSLFYHLFDQEQHIEPVFSLSFLEERPPSARSQTVLGWLPVLAHGASGLNDFVENRRFTSLLHDAVKEGLLEDEIWKNSAIQIQRGWMHIFDQRNPPPLGRIPDPHDILASVRVEDGRMLIDTYEPMPSYRLCTADGVCQLTDTLVDHMKTMLVQVANEERKNCYGSACCSSS